MSEHDCKHFAKHCTYIKFLNKAHLTSSWQEASIIDHFWGTVWHMTQLNCHKQHIFI